jgi:uncharacterized protein YbbC (DUF1343 family)
MGLVGETDANEGRGTETLFSLFGAPWLDATRIAGRLGALGLPGVTFEAITYTPRSIPCVATHPRHEGRSITDIARFEPLETGIHMLAALAAEARSRGDTKLFRNLAMLHALAGTKRLHRMLESGRDGAAIIAAWQDEVAQFKSAAPAICSIETSDGDAPRSSSSRPARRHRPGVRMRRPGLASVSTRSQ